MNALGKALFDAKTNNAEHEHSGSTVDEECSAASFDAVGAAVWVSA
jgi:hypothetical protein